MELLDFLAEAGAVEAVRRLERRGWLATVLPEVAACRAVAQGGPHTKDVFDHQLDVLGYVIDVTDWLRSGEAWRGPDFRTSEASVLSAHGQRLRQHFGEEVAGAPRWQLLRLAALLHDIGKVVVPAGDTGKGRFAGHAEAGAVLAEAALERLRLPAPQVACVARVIGSHQRLLRLARAGLGAVEARAFHDRLRAEAAEAVVLSLADNASKTAAEPDRMSLVAGAVTWLLDAWPGEPRPESGHPAGRSESRNEELRQA